MRESLSGKFMKKEVKQQYITNSPQINSDPAFFEKKCVAREKTAAGYFSS